MKYFDMGYFKECIDVCRAIIVSYDDYQTEINYDMYVRIYSVLYHSLIKMGSFEAEYVAQKIRKYYKSHPIFAHNYDNLKRLCGIDDFKL